MALTKKKELAAQTKKHLYQVAIRLFKEKSFQEVTVDEIVNEAGSSKGAFYFHFKSKDHIIAYLFEQIDAYYSTTLTDLASYKTGAEKLIRFITLQARYSVETFGVEFSRIIYGAQLVNDKIDHVIDDPNRNLFSVLRCIVHEAQKTGEFRTDLSEDQLLKYIARNMRALYYDWCLEGFDLEKEGVEYFSCFVLHGLLSHPASNGQVLSNSDENLPS